jgi:hypothetical protein
LPVSKTEIMPGYKIGGEARGAIPPGGDALRALSRNGGTGNGRPEQDIRKERMKDFVIRKIWQQ